MKEAFINFQLGVLKQNVFIHDKESLNVDTVNCAINEIPDYIIASNVDTVHISGSKDYMLKIKKQVQAKEIEKYGKNNIKFVEGD